MSTYFTYFDDVDVYDDDVFTAETVADWKMHLISSYEVIFHKAASKIDNSNQLEFFIDSALLDEVTSDAIIGMRKITDSRFNSIEHPNAFKVAAYLGYWWLRHKPVSIHYESNIELDKLIVKTDSKTSPEDQEYERKKFIWKLKHINEIVAVQIVATYVFDFNKVICGPDVCSKLKGSDYTFTFDSFVDMREELLGKMTYYFAYRAIAPKVIEHIIEGYSFHPAWALTGPHWLSEDAVDES